MKRILLSVFFVLAGSMAAVCQETVSSPDGKVSVTVSDEGGSPKYQVSLDGQVFIQSSPLGLVTNFDDFTQGLEMKGCEVKTVTDDYWLKTTKQSHICYKATEAVCTFEKGGKKAFDVIFRVTDRDVAYRYKIYPKKVRGGETMSAVVMSEASGFVLPELSEAIQLPVYDLLKTN